MHTVKNRLSPLRLVASWGQSRRLSLLYAAFFAGILFLVYRLYGLPWEIATYTALLGAAGGLCFAVGDFFRFLQQHRTLEKLPGRFPLGTLPSIQDQIARDYEAVISSLESERIRLCGEYERQRLDAEQYYTLWAHQTKTSIAAMRLLLQKGQPPSFSDLEAELLRIEQYVGMVMQYQRLDSLNSDLTLEKLSVNAMVRCALKNLAPLFISKNLPLKLGVLDGEVTTDSKWFIFVLEQIMTNALKYTNRGTVSIYTKDNTLTIADTGIGIAGEDIPRVFERGYTGATGRIDRQSSGIGLYLCKQIIDRLGLSIGIESQIGIGTKVHIVLTQNILDTE